MQESNQVISEVFDNFTVITLNRPEKRNALNIATREQLIKALVNAKQNSKAIIITGAREFFCSGGDISEMEGEPSRRLSLLEEIARQIIKSKVPVITAVEGGAFGAGLALVASSFYSICSQNSEFEASFSRLGLGPDTGLSWSLPRRVGSVKAEQMILLATRIKADAALEIGLVDRVVPAGESLLHAKDLAEKISLISQELIKMTPMITEDQEKDLENHLARETRMQKELLKTREFHFLQEKFLGVNTQKNYG